MVDGSDFGGAYGAGDDFFDGQGVGVLNNGIGCCSLTAVGIGNGNNVFAGGQVCDVFSIRGKSVRTGPGIGVIKCSSGTVRSIEPLSAVHMVLVMTLKD
jgi:hypothetical protein